MQKSIGSGTLYLVVCIGRFLYKPNRATCIGVRKKYLALDRTPLPFCGAPEVDPSGQ